MLSPRYLAGISDDIVRIYAQLEHDIVIDMARRLHKMGAVSDASVWQAGVFNEIGGLQADVQKYLAKYDKQAQKEISALFEEALRKSDKADMRVFDAAKRNMSDRQRLIFEAIAEKQQSAGIVTGSKAAQEGIIKTFSNLSRLTMSIAATSSADFITQANAAFMQTVTGAFDYQTALKNAVKNLAQKGIHTVEYTDSGKRILRSIEGAVRSNILTGINQTASRRTLDNCQELDCDLVEVSAHMGARPSHAAWQGKIYSLSGTSDKYPSFYKECRPGEPDGIGGVNCRHSYYPYFEGMPRMYSDGELDEMKEPTVEYNGKKITQYEAEQNLRALERGIRKHKLEVDALEAAELDATAEKQRLGAWQAKAREYCKETGIRRDYSREYVGTASGKQPKGLQPAILGYSENLQKAQDIKRLDNARNKTIAQVKQGKPMNFQQADGGAPNPNYNKGGGYAKNCQSCVVAYELRRRGFDVEALAYYEGSMLNVLSRDTRLAWVDRETGKNPSYIVPAQSTVQKSFDWMKTELKTKNRYTIEFQWKNKTVGHIVHIFKGSDDTLSIYDPQKGLNTRGDNAVIDYLKRVRPSTIRLLDVQNYDINMNVVNKILQEAKK